MSSKKETNDWLVEVYTKGKYGSSNVDHFERLFDVTDEYLEAYLAGIRLVLLENQDINYFKIE